jgi:hypothetical protein
VAVLSTVQTLLLAASCHHRRPKSQNRCTLSRASATLSPSSRLSQVSLNCLYRSRQIGRTSSHLSVPTEPSVSQQSSRARYIFNLCVYSSSSHLMLNCLIKMHERGRNADERRRRLNERRDDMFMLYVTSASAYTLRIHERYVSSAS